MRCGGRSSDPRSWLGLRPRRTPASYSKATQSVATRAASTPNSSSAWEPLFRDLREDETLDDTLFNVGLSYLLLGAWQAFADSDDVVGGDVHPAVDRVARLLHANPGAGHLADLARTVGLSPSHLSRLFKMQMGLSISRFRNQQRLQRFLRLYGNGRRTTALAAAHQAGFGSYAQFYRVFRQEAGRHPSALRTAAADDNASLTAPPDHPLSAGPASTHLPISATSSPTDQADMRVIVYTARTALHDHP